MTHIVVSYPIVYLDRHAIPVKITWRFYRRNTRVTLIWNILAPKLLIWNFKNKIKILLYSASKEVVKFNWKLILLNCIFLSYQH